jgi:glycyl-tRNA synthetase beta chain
MASQSMAELLFEISCEEIPARLQVDYAAKLYEAFSELLKEYGVLNLKGRDFVTPRRLGFVIENMPLELSMHAEEIKGPKVSAPLPAIEGFLKKYGISQADLENRGEYYFYTKAAKSFAANEVLAVLLPKLISEFTWPKSMCWGREKVTWIRPITAILAILAGKVIDFNYGQIKSAAHTYGHRFMNFQKIEVSDYADYQKQLAANNVMMFPHVRQTDILTQVNSLIAGKGITMIDDQDLLAEVVGLVEKPTVYLSEIDEEFMSLPKEVLIITLRHHQRYIMFNHENGELAKYFAIVSNTKPNDGGKTIIEGNLRVLRARLYDAKFFYENDLKTPLENNLEALKNVVYHQKVGSVYDKVMRVVLLAVSLAKDLGVDVGKVERAAKLAKADLVSHMVKEFPELQGIMGYYYAIAQGEDEKVAQAILEHYKPQGPSDSLPTNVISAIVALADKMDSLNSLFKVGIKPTGSKDPFAQRRAAIGILRIIKEAMFAINLNKYVSEEVLQFIEERAGN